MRRPFQPDLSGRSRAHLLESPVVVCGGLQIFERSDPEVVMQPIGDLSSDARDEGEELRGIAFAAQAIQHRQATAREQVANGVATLSRTPGSACRPSRP
jgi:hypothetical protein